MSYRILQEILDLLHPDVIGRKIEYVHNRIREEWTVNIYKAGSYEEAHEYLTNYYQYHHARWMRVGVKVPDEIAYSIVREILDKSEGGFVLNIKNALRARNGGMITLVDMIAEHFKVDNTERYIRHVIGTKCNPLDFDLKVRLAKAYLERYGQNILPGEPLMSPYELAADFESIIKAHVTLVNKYRNLVQ